MKQTAFKITLVLIIALTFTAIFSGCDLLGGLFETYTIKAKSYVEYPYYATIHYRESGTTEWKDADLHDENGNTVVWIVYNNSDYPDTAYFDVPGAGTCDFRALDLLGGVAGDGTIENCTVEYSNQSIGDIYGHNITISSLSSVHGFM